MIIESIVYVIYFIQDNKFKVILNVPYLQCNFFVEELSY